MTINMKIYNSFTNKMIVMMSMPYDKIKSMDGFYSETWRDMRTICANVNKSDKHWIRLKHWIEKKNTDRMIMTFPKGASVDMPFVLNKTDIKIINLHIEALKLAKGIKD